MTDTGWLAIAALLLHWTLVIGLSARVIMRRRPLGILLAWIALILSLPVVGVVLYLFVGENRVSKKYLRRAKMIHEQYSRWKRSLGNTSTIDWSLISPAARSLHRQAQLLVGFPALPGNRLELLEDYERVFCALIDDIRRCRGSCHLEFYILHAGGLVDTLLGALIDAAKRGVVCRLLLDAVGSKPFLGSAKAAQLEAAGVEIAVALPVSPLTAFLSRADLRNHRKIAVIDAETAYTGSQNLVDPRFFKQDEGVGQWVDAMVRIEGPSVAAMAGTFAQDWEIVTGRCLQDFGTETAVERAEQSGSAVVQWVPSGPQPKPLAIQQLVLSTLYSAQERLIITTPYFVPDESILTALVSAAHRGVDVTLVIPAKNDSRLVDYASRAVFDDLLEAGVHIAAFNGGLLHTKSITVDGELCLFGSLNLDMRSLWLNFEISLFIYDNAVTSRICEMQLAYLERSDLIDVTACQQRPFARRFLENAVHLLAPLL
jgi:cardiolipin synthase